MKSHPGIAAKTFATLAGEGIEPEIVNTSPIKIACFVERGEVDRAVRALHADYGLDLGYELDRARAGADDGDSSAGEFVLVVPVRRVEPGARERVEPQVPQYHARQARAPPDVAS